MLYLISVKNQRIIKIGYTNNWAKRMNDYAGYNPFAYPIDTKEGGTKEEKNWHLALEYLGFKRITVNEIETEWFEIPKGVSKIEIRKNGFKYLMELCLEFAEKENA